MTDEKMYTFWLCNKQGIGIKKITDLLCFFKEAEYIFKASKEELMQVRSLKEKDIDLLLSGQDEDRLKRDYEEMYKKGIQFVYKKEEQYPDKLRFLQDAPYGLFYKGHLPQKGKVSVAIVGSRRVSYEGRALAQRFGKELAEHGIEVVSGLALGVDIAAQRGAMEVPCGKTFSVLGNGVDICYPAQHIEEYMRMQQYGGVLSEFPLNAPSMPYHFPMRNRIISGLSDGILVIEAKKGSGSLITAETGLEQGREIFVVPGNITNPQYEGGNELLKSGACLVTNIKDILDGLGLFYDEDVENRKKKYEVMLETTEKIVYAILSLEPLHISQIAQMCGLDINCTMEALLSLQTKKMVEMAGGSYYMIKM